jgi:hypothetical protein
MLNKVNDDCPFEPNEYYQFFCEPNQRLEVVNREKALSISKEKYNMPNGVIHSSFKPFQYVVYNGIPCSC